MEFNAAYPWFGPGFVPGFVPGFGWGLGALSKPRYEFVPIWYPHVAEVLRDPSRRSTLRMQWRVQVDPDGKLCLRAMWDARRHDRSVSEQA